MRANQTGRIGCGLTILLLAAASGAARAQEPLGSGFTYRGQLKLAGQARWLEIAVRSPAGGDFELVGGFWAGAGGDNPPCDPCDMNCDGTVDAGDIENFIGLLFEGATPCGACTGDTNGDGFIDAADIEGFINCLFP